MGGVQGAGLAARAARLLVDADQGADGRVVGTFAFYFREPRGASDHERQIVARCTDLCAVLIENHEYRQRAHEQAFVDAMSGLPNRASFDLRLAQTIADRRRFALLFADLDPLKRVNDTLGHAAGDALIRVASTRLKSIGPQVDVFRLGGDEFAFIHAGCTSEAMMESTAQALIGAVCQPVEYHGMTLAPSLTVGGVFQGEAGFDKSTLYQNADFALYHAKEVNRGGFVAFRQGMRTTMTQRLRAMAEVDRALAEGRIVPHYQPIVRLDSAEIVGLEALARICDREGGMLEAAEFQSAFGDPRLAYALTTEMLKQVAADIRYWLDLKLPLQHVGFNVTTADLQKGDLERRITSAFCEGEEALKHLVLEVNEAVFVNDDIVADEIKGLRGKGILVALDDFGTGSRFVDTPARISGRHHEDRQVVHRQDRRRCVERCDRPGPARYFAQAGDADRGRRRRDEGTGGEATGDGLRLAQGYYFARPASAAITAELLGRFGQRASVPERAEARTCVASERPV